MTKKYISHSGVTIEIGDFYGGGLDEVVSSLEDDNTNLRIITNQDIYLIQMQAGDFLSFADGSSKIVKHNHDNNDI